MAANSDVDTKYLTRLYFFILVWYLKLVFFCKCLTHRLQWGWHLLSAGRQLTPHTCRPPVFLRFATKKHTSKSQTCHRMSSQHRLVHFNAHFNTEQTFWSSDPIRSHCGVFFVIRHCNFDKFPLPLPDQLFRSVRCRSDKYRLFIDYLKKKKRNVHYTRIFVLILIVSVASMNSVQIVKHSW